MGILFELYTRIVMYIAVKVIKVWGNQSFIINGRAEYAKAPTTPTGTSAIT
jgi:hypothetical protein